MLNRKIENKIIAACMVVFCLLMAAMVFLTYRVTGRACRCDGVIPAGIEEIDNVLDALSRDLKICNPIKKENTLLNFQAVRLKTVASQETKRADCAELNARRKRIR